MCLLGALSTLDTTPAYTTAVVCGPDILCRCFGATATVLGGAPRLSLIL